jgi:glycosyltransferase involved in cell wall biosynthesis
MKITFLTYTNISCGFDFIIFDSIDRVRKYFDKNNIEFCALLQPMPGESDLNIRTYKLNIKNSFIFTFFQFLLNKLSFNRNKTSVLLKIRDLWSVLSILNSNKFSSDDYIIAVESINCLPLIWYRFFFSKNYKVIYFCNDYSDNRYSFFLNYIYNSLDKFCAYNSDYNILMNMNIQHSRKEKGYDLGRISSLFDISGGISSSFANYPFKSRIIKKPVKLIYASRDIVYGLKIVFQLLFDCLSNSIDAHLVITGHCTEYDVKILFLKYPHFQVCSDFFSLTGFVSTQDLDEFIYNSDIGLAIYPFVGNSSSVFGDPEKIRRYFNSGIPIIASGTGEAIDLINSTKSGILCESSSEFISALISLVDNPLLYSEFCFNSYQVGRSYKTNDKFMNFINHLN